MMMGSDAMDQNRKPPWATEKEIEKHANTSIWYLQKQIGH
jgi:hypothetical protein